jgi:hypothetical protein
MTIINELMTRKIMSISHYIEDDEKMTMKTWRAISYISDPDDSDDCDTVI